MRVFDAFREAVGTDEITLFECRNCGEKLPEDASKCVSFGAAEIAHYEL